MSWFGDQRQATTPQTVTANCVVGSIFTLSEAGSVTAGKAWIKPTTLPGVKMLIFNTSWTLLGVSNANATGDEHNDPDNPNEFDFTFGTPVALSAGNYHLALIADGTFDMRYTTDTVTGIYDDSNSYTTPVDGGSDTGEDASRSYSLYAIYTPSGEAASGTAAFGAQSASVAAAGLVIAAPAYGYATPDAGELATSWTTWKTAGGSTVTVTGDVNYGDAVAPTGEPIYGPVVDTGDANNKTFTVTCPKYGTNSGGVTVEYRGSASAFAWNDGSPSWATYTTTVTQEWQYFQVRCTGA